MRTYHFHTYQNIDLNFLQQETSQTDFVQINFDSKYRSTTDRPKSSFHIYRDYYVGE